MTTYNCDTWLKPVLLYFITVFAMIASMLYHLNDVAKGLENLQPSHIMIAWPVVFTIPSALLLVISGVMSSRNPMQAAKLGFVACIIGWAYFLPMICFGFFTLSIFIFIHPLACVVYIMPSVLLMFTTVYCKRHRKAEKLMF